MMGGTRQAEVRAKPHFGLNNMWRRVKDYDQPIYTARYP